MTYPYTYSRIQTDGSPLVGFSDGRLLPAPLPLVDNNRAYYPETSTFGGFSECRATQYSGFGVNPTEMCSLLNPCCANVDMNADGDFTDMIRTPIEVGFGGNYEIGRYQVSGSSANYYWCDTAGVTVADAHLGGYCCGAPMLGGVCPDGASRTESPVTHTMLTAGQPTAFIANNSIYMVYVDDVVSADDVVAGALPPRRSEAGSPSYVPRIPSGAAVGKLRWAAFDSFALPAGANVDSCLSTGSSCPVERNRNAGREVIVDGHRVADIAGSTILASTTLRNAASGSDVVFVGWTTRGSVDPFTGAVLQAGLECPSGVDCGTLWRGVSLAWASARALESAGLVSAVAPPFPSGHADGLSIAAWNPADAGRPTRAMVVARDPVTHLAHWMTCGFDGVCDAAWRSLRQADGSQVVSASQLAIAVERRSDDSVRPMWLLYGVPDSQLGFVDLRLLRLDPETVPVAGIDRAVEWVDTGIGTTPRVLRALDDSAVSAAFTGELEPGVAPENRLVISFEHPYGVPAVVCYATSRAPMITDSSAGFVLMTGRDCGPWDASRTNVRAASGIPVTASAPGGVAGLLFDDRDLTLDPSLAFLARRMRGARIAQVQYNVQAQLDSIADGLTTEQHFDYDDQSTLAFELCPLIEAGSLGRRGPDLSASSVDHFGPLSCAGALRNAADSSLVLNRLEPYAL
ncbi:MAG: hypothetical protein WCJ30_15905, partial [Deltaproteobacteria bacterium]